MELLEKKVVLESKTEMFKKVVCVHKNLYTVPE